jgi:putative glycerol-1-phosphate prenyltransferase
MIYDSIIAGKTKKIALLIDPDKHSETSLIDTIVLANQTGVDFILAGGSLVSRPIDHAIEIIKKTAVSPVILFPGSLMQLTDKADGILLLSLISGRNSDYLIGNHVLAAPFLKNSGIEIIPTGYILVDGKSVSSVEYISGTRPIPIEKTDIIVATALAGEMLGHKLIYLEAGSGANNRVNEKIVASVKEKINIPLMIGGGIRTPDDALSLFKAGADILVIGSVIEDNPGMLKKIMPVKTKM